MVNVNWREAPITTWLLILAVLLVGAAVVAQQPNIWVTG